MTCAVTPYAWCCAVSRLWLLYDVCAVTPCAWRCAVSRLRLMRDVCSHAVRVVLRRTPPVAYV